MTKEDVHLFHHIMPLQLRFSDVDKFGHVNNTVYFQFYDTAKTDYFASVCKDVDWERIAIVVVKIEAEFVAQIKAGSHIAARTRVTRIGNVTKRCVLRFQSCNNQKKVISLRHRK